jgi:hypothetical protein
MFNLILACVALFCLQSNKWVTINLFEAISMATIFSFFSCYLFARFTILTFGTGDKYKDFHNSLTVSLLVFILLQFSVLNIDRSRSFYVLSWVHDGLVTKSGSDFDLDKVKSTEKFSSNGISLRIREQSERGLINSEMKTLTLTEKGEIYLVIAKFLASTFKLDNWYKNNH